MPEQIRLQINGISVTVPEGSMVSAAVVIAGAASFRRSVTNEQRALLCGMGICFECRVTINGRAHCRSCQIPCQNGMNVRTDE